MDKETLRALHVIVKGRVQGVGFRYWTRSLAKSLNVKGRVRNLADYSVESLNSEEVRARGYTDFRIEV